MMPPSGFLSDLLRTEHVAAARALAEARSDADLRRAAEAALLLASRLLSAVRSARNPHEFLGVPFWYFPTQDAFAQGWPAPDRDLPPAGEADPEAPAAAEAVLPGRSLRMLCRPESGTGGEEGEGGDEDGEDGDIPVLVIDTGLASDEQMITFLFGLALGRLPARAEMAALKDSIGPDGADRNAAFNRLCGIILDSVEAQARGATWQLM